MGRPDQFSQHYEKQQERKRSAADVQSDDDAPVPDAPVEQAQRSEDPGRNDPCPCGSGQKYKKCCGKAK